MANQKDPYPGSPNQPAPKLIPNQPAASVAQALANAEKQVDQANKQ